MSVDIEFEILREDVRRLFASVSTLKGDRLADADRFQGRRLRDVKPSDADVLKWNNTSNRWEPEAPSTAVVHTLDSTHHSDVATITENTDDMLIWNGSAWADVGRSGTAQIADIANTEAAGSNTTVPYGDHVHAHPSGLTATLHHALTSAADAGHTVASEAITSVASSTTVTGHVELATTAETTTGTDTGRAIPVSALPSQIQDSNYVFAADAEASDTYVITLAPAPSAYATGQVFHFSANTANTGAATLNVNGLGAITIKKLHDTDLATGDIEAGQHVMVEYDGTNFQMQSQIAAAGGGGGGLSLTTKGDLHSYDTGDVRLPVGADDTVLQSESAETIGLIWRAAPRIANIADTGGVNRIDINTSAPHVDINDHLRIEGRAAIDSNVNLNQWLTISPAMGALGANSTMLDIAPTVTSGSFNWFGIDVSPVVIFSGANRSAVAIGGTLSGRPQSGITISGVTGLQFSAGVTSNELSSGQTGTATLVRAVQGNPVLIQAVSGSTLNVTNMYAYHATYSLTVIFGSATISTCKGIYLEDPNNANVTDYIGVHVDDETAASGNIYLIELGPSTPYFRVVGNFTAAANVTPVYISEGATPTLRQLKSTDMAFYSVTSDDTSTSSSALYDVWDQDNYPGATLNTTDNVTAKNITYTKSNGRFTLDVAGIYEITFTISPTSASSAIFLIELQDGGAAFYSHSCAFSHASLDPTLQSITVIRSFSAADYLNVLINGTNLVANVGTTLTIHKLADITDDKVATFAN